MANFDLHFHSTYSDGKLSVSELATIIEQKKVKYCALVDHNTVDGVQELIEYFNDSQVKVIPGVELTAKYNDNDVHILAYDFDISLVAKVLKERNEIVRCKKNEEMMEAIKLLRQAGLYVSADLVPTDKQPVTLTLALDICANSFNQNIFLKKHGKLFKPEDVYYEFQAPGLPCAVERSGVTVEWLVQKLKYVASDLIIAHPFISVSVVTRSLVEAEIYDLLKIGLTGIEVYHNNTSNEQIKQLKIIVQEQGIHYNGGSDFHGNPTDTPLGEYGHDNILPDFHLANYKFY